jgi:hypothetical protein
MLTCMLYYEQDCQQKIVLGCSNAELLDHDPVH